MGNLALYQLADEFSAAADRVADLDLPPEVVADTLESMALPFEGKARAVAAFARNLEATADQIKQARRAMERREEAILSRAKHVRDYLLTNMLRCEITRIEHPEFVIAVRANPESVVIDDERQIPLEYMRQPEPPPPAPDKTAIKSALKAGQDVPGARIVKTQRLEIK